MDFTEVQRGRDSDRSAGQPGPTTRTLRPMLTCAATLAGDALNEPQPRGDRSGFECVALAGAGGDGADADEGVGGHVGLSPIVQAPGDDPTALECETVEGTGGDGGDAGERAGRHGRLRVGVVTPG